MNDLRIKKRKHGKCSWCGEEIPVGSEYVWWPSVNDDGIPNGSCSMHPECNGAYRDSYRETFRKFEFVRGQIHKKPEITEAEDRQLNMIQVHSRDENGNLVLKEFSGAKK